MTLDEARKGSQIRIVGIRNPEGKSQLVRMGISEGTMVTCQENMPFGPIVLKCNRQEIAIGRQLARNIDVR